MMAEGDRVRIHSRCSNPDGSAIVVVDIMRIKGNETNYFDAQPGLAHVQLSELAGLVRISCNRNRQQSTVRIPGRTVFI